MRAIRLALLAAALACAAAPAPGFNADGHLAVGAIADALIAGTPTAAQVRKVLGTNLRTASVWADCAKGVDPASFEYRRAGFVECAVYENPASMRLLEDFVRRNSGSCGPQNADPCHKQYHYTDVALQRWAYEPGRVGTSGHDVVAAMRAAIAVLRGQPSPAPLRIATRKEALRLLAHFAGDIHQPLHVGAVYLDAAGRPVDPDQDGFDPRTQTQGGNLLVADTRRLHGLWDGVPAEWSQHSPPASVLKTAAAVPVTPGDPSTWPAAWATESLGRAQAAYHGLAYSAKDAQGRHQVTLPPGYEEAMLRTQREQVTQAGARLAQLLRRIWP